MVLVAVKHEDILHGAKVPNELLDFILPSQWSMLTGAVNDSYEFGHFWSCACEISVAICFVFPCIFCFHPYISNRITKDKMEEKIRFLNHQIFEDQPVLSLLDGNIFINTEYIVGAQQTQYISRTLTNDSSSFNAMHSRDTTGSASSVSSGGPRHAASVQGPGMFYDQSNYIEVIATPAAEAVRTIVVTIPQGAGPGSLLTVAAPNGTTISVVAPEGSYPGKEITVQY